MSEQNIYSDFVSNLLRFGVSVKRISDNVNYQ